MSRRAMLHKPATYSTVRPLAYVCCYRAFIYKIMFKLELYDRIGNKLNLGDIVKVSNGREFSFYAEVKYLENEKVITPFHTFSFHSFEKVDKIPEHAKKSTEERYNIWYTHSPELDEKEAAEYANKYLIDWRQCEHLLEKRCFRVELL